MIGEKIIIKNEELSIKEIAKITGVSKTVVYKAWNTLGHRPTVEEIKSGCYKLSKVGRPHGSKNKKFKIFIDK